MVSGVLATALGDGATSVEAKAVVRAIVDGLSSQELREGLGFDAMVADTAVSASISPMLSTYGFGCMSQILQRLVISTHSRCGVTHSLLDNNA